MTKFRLPLVNGDALPGLGLPGSSFWPPGCVGADIQPGGRTWELLSRCGCTLLGCLGLALLIVCSYDFFGPLKTHGQLLGLGCLALCALGWASCTSLPAAWGEVLGGATATAGSGSSSRGAAAAAAGDRLSLRTALLIGLAWGAMSTISLMEQAARDVGLDCELAEALVRIEHLETRLTAQKHDEMMTNVFFRLNEVDDMLDQVQQVASGEVAARDLVLGAKMQDKEYISSRVARLQKHAQKVAAELRARAVEVRASAAKLAPKDGRLPTEPDEAMRKSTEAIWLLEKRIEAVDSVVHYLESKHQVGELSFDEYQMILAALVEGGSQGVGGHLAGADVIDVELLRGEQINLAPLQAAFDRKVADRYHRTLEGGPQQEEVKKLKLRREAARKEFETRFLAAAEKHVPTHPGAFKESLTEALDDLPEHCLSEAGGLATVQWLSLGLLVAQALCGYVALTAMVVRVAAARKSE